jgi:hypothetical protein
MVKVVEGGDPNPFAPNLEEDGYLLDEPYHKI